jgi:MFS family permease
MTVGSEIDLLVRDLDYTSIRMQHWTLAQRGRYMEKQGMVQDIARTEAREAPAREGIWSGSNRSLTIGLLMTVVGVAFEALAVATTLPATTRDLGGIALYGWAFSAFMLTNLIGITIAGSEADRQGPARPYIIGVALFAIGLTIAGTAPAMEVVILGRAVQGFGAGVISSVAYVAIGRAYSESARPRMLAVLSSAWVVPGLVGPALAGLIADHVGWRWVFLGLVPLPLVAASLALPGLRRLARSSSAPRDWNHVIASVRLTIGAGLLLAGLGTPSLPLAAGLVVVGALLGYPALRRLLPEGTLRAAPGLPAAIAAHGLLNLAFFGADSFVPLALTAARGQSATAAGLALTAATVTWTTGSWIQAHFAQRQERRWLVVVGLVLVAAGIAGIAMLLNPAVPVVLAPVAWGVAGLGIGIAFSTNSLVVLETAPAGQEGTASAALQLANVLGVALGAGIGGAIIGYSAAGGAPQSGIFTQDMLMIGVAALAIVTALRLPRRAGAAPEATTGSAIASGEVAGWDADV